MERAGNERAGESGGRERADGHGWCMSRGRGGELVKRPSALVEGEEEKGEEEKGPHTKVAIPASLRGSTSPVPA